MNIVKKALNMCTVVYLYLNWIDGLQSGWAIAFLCLIWESAGTIESWSGLSGWHSMTPLYYRGLPCVPCVYFVTNASMDGKLASLSNRSDWSKETSPIIRRLRIQSHPNFLIVFRMKDLTWRWPYLGKLVSWKCTHFHLICIKCAHFCEKGFL